jgi:hypothetical protein
MYMPNFANYFDFVTLNAKIYQNNRDTKELKLAYTIFFNKSSFWLQICYLLLLFRYSVIKKFSIYNSKVNLMTLYFRFAHIIFF